MWVCIKWWGGRWCEGRGENGERGRRVSATPIQPKRTQAHAPLSSLPYLAGLGEGRLGKQVLQDVERLVVEPHGGPHRPPRQHGAVRHEHRAAAVPLGGDAAVCVFGLGWGGWVGGLVRLSMHTAALRLHPPAHHHHHHHHTLLYILSNQKTDASAGEHVQPQHSTHSTNSSHIQGLGYNHTNRDSPPLPPLSLCVYASIHRPTVPPL